MLNKSCFKLDHFAIAVNSIESAKKFYEALGFTSIEDSFTDLILGVRGVFLKNEQGIKLELLEEIPQVESPLTPWLKRGKGLYQIAFRVDSMEDAASILTEQQGCRKLSEVSDSVWFAPNQVQFFMSPHGYVIETISNVY